MVVSTLYSSSGTTSGILQLQVRSLDIIRYTWRCFGICELSARHNTRRALRLPPCRIVYVSPASAHNKYPMCTPSELSKISMIPYYNYRGPSRILWFLIGAVTTNWLLKRKDCDSRIFGHCRRLQYQMPQPNSVPDGTPFAPSAPNSWSVTVRDILRTTNNIPHWGTEQQQPWLQEKEYFGDISRKVTDAVRSYLSFHNCITHGFPDDGLN